MLKELENSDEGMIRLERARERIDQYVAGHGPEEGEVDESSGKQDFESKEKSHKEMGRTERTVDFDLSPEKNRDEGFDSPEKGKDKSVDDDMTQVELEEGPNHVSPPRIMTPTKHNDSDLMKSGNEDGMGSPSQNVGGESGQDMETQDNDVDKGAKMKRCGAW